MSLPKNKLLLPIFLFGFLTVVLFYLFGSVNSVAASVCESENGTCVSSSECELYHGVTVPAGTCPSGQVCCENGHTTGGGTGGTSSPSGAPTLGKISITVPVLGTIVRNLYLLALFAAAVFFLIQFAIGGLSWMAAGGDPKNLEAARNRLTNALIGLVIVVAAFGVTTIVLSALGINIFTGQEIQIFK